MIRLAKLLSLIRQNLILLVFSQISISPKQSVTYRYREFPVPGIFHFFGGIGTSIGKIWYRKKVSESVSEKFGTGKSPGTGIGKIWYRKKYRYRYRKYLVPEKSIGIGIV